VTRFVKEEWAGLPTRSPLEPNRPHSRLFFNESGVDFPQHLKDEVLDRLQQAAWNRYPAYRPEHLGTILASHLGCKPENVTLGHGSGELAQLVFQACLRPGDKVIIPVPTYFRHPLACQALGAEVVKLTPNSERFALDLDLVVEEAKNQKAKMVVLCSPNNPTGYAIPYAVLDRCLPELNCLVLLDGAYLEFSSEDYTSLVEKHPNLFLLRTMSKAFSLAGMRIGYGLADPSLTGTLHKNKLPFCPSLASSIAAEVAVENWPLFRDEISRVCRTRDELANCLGECVYPSEGNFLLIRTPLESEVASRKLLEKGFWVGSFGPGILEKHIRVSIGTFKEVEVLKSSLLSILRENKEGVV